MFDIRDGGDEPGKGFQVRDLLRFFAVDIIILFLSKLFLLLGWFASPGAYVLAILAGKAILLCYLAWLVRNRENAWPETGAASAGRWWGWLLSLGLYAGCYPLLLWADRLNIGLLRSLYASFGMIFVPTPQTVVILIFEDLLANPTRLVLVAFVVLVGPFMEELAFRGLGLDAFGRTGGAARAVFWTSLLFGLYHFSLQALIPLSILGAIFAAARLLTRSLWGAVAVHCLHNSLTLAITARELGWLDAVGW